jgi:Fungal trichothecene efflux pump (TRI12)
MLTTTKSAVNSITPQLVLYLGFEDDSWRISVRQLSFSITGMVFSIFITAYSTRFKDLRSPLLVTFTIFLIVCICYTCIKPTWNRAQIGITFLSGVGQAGPLTLLVACVQFTAPHAFLSTATGLAFSARAIGGAFGSAVLDAIVNNYIAQHYAGDLGKAATGAGLPESSVPALVEAFTAGNANMMEAVPDVSPAILGAATNASRWCYAHAYRLAWASIIPFVVLALVAVGLLKGVKELMTEHVEATVEKSPASLSNGKGGA